MAITPARDSVEPKSNTRFTGPLAIRQGREANDQEVAEGAALWGEPLGNAGSTAFMA